MTLLIHELKRNMISFVVWTLAISLFIAMCIFMFPSMKDSMSDVSDMFSSMGSFTAAFGMDKINFGEFLGYYGIECGNILGMGGALFASILGINSLAKEESEHTADFLFTHPISRLSAITQKLLAVFIQVFLLNAFTLLVCFLSTLAIGESPDWSNFLLLNLGYFIMQIEIAAICFAISSFLNSNGMAIGLAIAVVAYFINILANISDKAKFLKYLSPFAYTESADIITNNSLDIKLILIGIGISVISVVIAFLKYTTKDLK